MNLFKKTTAAVALVTLVSGIFSTGVSAYSTSEVGAANALAEAGIINNHSDNSAAYNLDQNVLRQEIAAVARGIAGLPKATTYSAVFSDVTATTPNTWAWASVNALADAGLVAKNPTFRPEANISKAEAVGMVVKAAFGDAYAFDAAKGTTWQEQVVAFAVENGVVSSFTNYDTAATRGFVFEAGANALSSDDDSMDGLLEDLLGGLTDDEETTTDDETTVTTPLVDGDDVLEVALSPETPTLGYVPNNRARTELLAFDVTAGSEDVTLKDLTLEYVGLSASGDVKNLAVYMLNNEVTRSSKSFNSDKEADLTFEKDTVIKAGETQTLVVTATVTSTGNVSHKIALTNLESSSTVEGDYIVSNSFNVVDSSNTSVVEYKVSNQGGDLTVGEEDTLADFSFETSKEEDVTLKSLTFEFAGLLDAEEDLSDVVLYAEGKAIASDLTVNSDDEVIVSLDYTIPADEKIDFELKGTVTGSIGTSATTVKLTDIFVVGNESGMVSSVVNTSDVAFTEALLGTFASIVGSEINVSFDKSDIDEAKPNADKVLVGTLKLTAASDYTIERLVVKAESTNSGVLQIIDDMELEGVSYEKAETTNVGGTTASNTVKTVYFSFDDISLSSGETKELDLTFDTIDEISINGDDVTFTVQIINVTDEENDEDYTLANVGDILSTNSLDPKTIDIESASLTLTQTSVTQRTLVVGNGVEVVLYKGKLSVGDSDDVTLNDITLTKSSSTGVLVSSTGAAITSYDLKDILDSATLNIGGKTFDADLYADRVEFNSINAVAAAGSDNVEVTVTAVLKDTDDVSANDKLALTIIQADVEAEDAEGEAVSDNLSVTSVTSTNVLVLNEEGTLDFAVVTNGDNKDEIDDVVLAGTNGVAIAEVEFEANEENVKVEELVFTATGVDLSTTLENVRLVKGSNVIVDGAVVTYVGGNTVITFKNDFTVETASNKVKALLVADLNTVTTEGGEVSALSNAQVSVGLTFIDSKGVNSNEDITADTSASKASLVVAVVPAIVTVSIVDELGNGDSTAIIRLTIDKGNNDLDNDDIALTSVEFEAIEPGIVIRNDDNETLSGSVSGNVFTFNTLGGDVKVVNGDEMEFKVAATNDEVRIKAQGIVYSIGGAGTYKVSNDKVMDLGEYIE